MNVKRTCLDALVATRLKAESRYNEWDVLSVADIRQNFRLATAPVFRVNGVNYAIKTRIGHPGLYAHELADQGCRQWLREQMIENIRRDELAQQRMRGVPVRLWVYCVKLNDVSVIHPDGSHFHKVFWRAAVVKP
jgi:hypothetical protein